MYSKELYASWLNATYGLSESIPELVPILNVPPLFSLEPCPAAAYAAIAITAMPIAAAATQRLLMFTLLARGPSRASSGRPARRRAPRGPVGRRVDVRASVRAASRPSPSARGDTPPSRRRRDRRARARRR